MIHEAARPTRTWRAIVRTAMRSVLLLAAVFFSLNATAGVPGGPVPPAWIGGVIPYLIPHYLHPRR